MEFPFGKLNMLLLFFLQSLAKNARFEQIWKSRKGDKEVVHDKALHEICHFYDIVRVDNEEKSKEAQHE